MATPSSEALSQEQRCLDAHRLALEGDPEGALRLLGDSDEPVFLRTRVAILIDTNRAEEAAALVRHRTPDEEWIDKAVFALARSGDFDTAEERLEWAKTTGERGLRTRSALAFARGVHALLVDTEGIVPGQVSNSIRDSLDRLVTAVRPIVEVVKANEGIETEVEEEAVSLTLSANYLRGDHTDRASLSKYLARNQPASLQLARLAVAGAADVPDDYPTRLREEHPDSLNAQFLALQIEGAISKRWSEAFVHGRALVSVVASRDDRLRLWSILHDIALHLDNEAIETVETLRNVLAKDEELIASYSAAERHLREGQFNAAGEILEAIRDDSDTRWMQLWAHYLLQSGKAGEAFEWFRKAAEVSPHPELLRRATGLAIEENDFEYAERALRQLVAIDQQDVSSREYLAQVLYRQGKFEEAAAHFKALYKSDNGRIDHGLAWANSLMRGGDHNGASQAYQELCSTDDAPSGAFIGAAILQRLTSTAHEAFATLHDVRNRFWDDPEFLTVILDLGYAAGREDVANEAMRQLLRLQERGESPEILKQASLDDVKKMFRSRTEYRAHLYEMHLTGKLPWLAVDRALGKASHSAWAYRTQELSFVVEDRLVLAEYVVYATNGFHPVLRPDGRRILEARECAPQGSVVAIDWSALITLYELDLLATAADFFETILVPADYYTRVVLEAPRLLPHQHSHLAAIERLREYIDRGQVAVVPQGGSPPDGIREISEYGDKASEHASGLHAIVDALSREGRISDSRRDVLLGLLKPRKRPDELLLGQQLLVPSSELLSLNQFGLLGEVVDTFRVHITEHDREEFIAGDREYRFMNRIRQSHAALWEQVREHDTYKPVPSVGRRYQNYQKDVPADEVAVASALIAQETGLPLLADDRVCQSLVANSRRTSATASFGTDRFLRAAHTAGLVDSAKLAKCYLRLITWRYRFFVPTAEVLLHYAVQYKNNPPGKELRSISRYAHDTMCDPGLFGGTEDTDIPTTIARRLFQEWLTLVATFVAGVWKDPSIPGESAETFTEWAALELLPTFIAAANANEARIVPAVTASALLGQAMIQTVDIDDPERSRRALMSLARNLGLNSAEYERIVLDTIDAI